MIPTAKSERWIPDRGGLRDDTVSMLSETYTFQSAYSELTRTSLDLDAYDESRREAQVQAWSVVTQSVVMMEELLLRLYAEALEVEGTDESIVDVLRGAQTAATSEPANPSEAPSEE